jgi:hypothetical protein
MVAFINSLIKLVLVSIFLLTQCSSPMHSKNKNRDLIIGQWEGKLNADTMILVFRKDSSVTFDYTKAGGIIKNYRYSFEGDNIIIIPGFEKLLIKELSNEALTFKPVDNNLKESIDIIFTIKFARTSHRAGVLSSLDNKAIKSHKLAEGRWLMQ